MWHTRQGPLNISKYFFFLLKREMFGEVVEHSQWWVLGLFPIEIRDLSLLTNTK